ncbi:hypothetical protein ACP4OV_016482 [Aristida adscensionis]
MPTPKQLGPMHPYFLLLATSLLLLSAAVPACTAQGSSTGDRQPPLVAHLAKDADTSLYTISVKDGGAPLVVDLAGPLVWSTCPPAHPTFPCDSGECAAANAQPGCENAGHGAAAAPDGGWSSRCRCTAEPCSPVPPGVCAPGDLTSFAMAAEATDGRNTLYPVSFTAVGSCAPDRLLRSLPAGAAGVAGLGRAALSLPSQLAAQRRFGRRFAVCLPGVALFGATPIYLTGYPPELTGVIARTPLAKNPRGGGYYLPVEGASVFWNGVTVPAASIPPGALAVDPWTGRGGVALSTVRRHTAVRGEVLRPLLQAFEAAVATAGYAVNKTAAAPPFQLCYDTFTMRRTKRTGWDFPSVRLELAAGASMNWSIDSGGYLVQQPGSRTACLGFVEMDDDDDGDAAAPAVVIGGSQLEDNLLVFDEDEEVLHFSGLLWGSGASCSSFNFSRANP